MSSGSSNRPPLISRIEAFVVGWAVPAMWLAMLLRLGWGFFADGKVWLLPSQAVGVLLLSSLANVASSYCPRPLAIIPALTSLTAWLASLSLLVRWGWPREPLATWLLIAAAVVWLASVAAVAYVRAQSSRTLRGHGYNWILDWAAERPYQSRLTALRHLRTLGYPQE